MSKEDKKKKEIYSYKYCRRIKRSDGIRMKAVKGYTFADFLDSIASRFGKLPCYSIFRDEASEITYSQLSFYAKSIASYLMKLGFEKGDKIAICAESSPHWMVMYLGITIIGCIAVPILPDFTERDISNIIADSGAKGIAVNSKTYSKARASIEAHSLKLFRIEDLVNIFSIPEGFTFSDAPGFVMTHQRAKDSELAKRKPEERDIASLIYTSGTTGTSKGVVLSHINLLRNADLSSDEYVKLNKGDRVLSILPMSHVYEFTCTQTLALMRGCYITFLGKPPAVSILMPAFSEIRPHVINSVPLLIEKIYRAAVLPQIKENKNIKKLMSSPFKGYVYRVIGNKLKATFGGRIKFFGIGGAALDPEVERFLYNAHFPYALGYGLTETSPLVAGCGSKHKWQKPGWIGKVVKDDHVVLLNKNEEGIGEIAVKGINVTSGYYNNDKLNAESFTEDGYFKTGDLGQLDKHNRLAIKGRVKTMILGPAGENIYPESIESLLNNMSFVQESLVVPEDGGLLALIKIDLKAFAEKMKLDMNEAKAEAKKYLEILKRDANSQLSNFSRLDGVELQETEFERTPTQKIKRFLYSSKDARRGRNEAIDGNNSNAPTSSEVKKADNINEKEAKALKKEKKSIKRDIQNHKIENKALKREKKRVWKENKRKLKAERASFKQDYKERFKRAKAERKAEKKALKSSYKEKKANIRRG